MTEAIAAAVTAIAAVVGGVSGIRQAPTYPNETQNVDPFAVTYFSSGNIEGGAMGTKRNLMDITVDLLIPRSDLARDMATLTPFVDTVSLALVGQISGTGARFGGTISTFDTLAISFLSQVDYGGVQMIGYRFTMQGVKILVSL